MGSLTFSAVCTTDCISTDALFASLYDELHRLAKRELYRQWGQPGLSVTTLLHEAYIDMSGRDGAAFPDQARFMGYASRVMRGLIIDRARSGGAIKRGGEFEITSLEMDVPAAPVDPADLTAIGDALDQLAEVEPDVAQVVDLKFFCGFSFAEIAKLLGVSERTAQRDWDKARILLQRYLQEQDSAAPPFRDQSP